VDDKNTVRCTALPARVKMNAKNETSEETEKSVYTTTVSWNV